VGVKQIRCPDCGYALLYATAGSKGSYKTDGDFAKLCALGESLKTLDALECPALRGAAERVLGLNLSSWAASSPGRR